MDCCDKIFTAKLMKIIIPIRIFSTVHKYLLVCNCSKTHKNKQLHIQLINMNKKKIAAFATNNISYTQHTHTQKPVETNRFPSTLT